MRHSISLPRASTARWRKYANELARSYRLTSCRACRRVSANDAESSLALLALVQVVTWTNVVLPSALSLLLAGVLSPFAHCAQAGEPDGLLWAWQRSAGSVQHGSW